VDPPSFSPFCFDWYYCFSNFNIHNSLHFWLQITNCYKFIYKMQNINVFCWFVNSKISSSSISLLLLYHRGCAKLTQLKFQYHQFQFTNLSDQELTSGVASVLGACVSSKAGAPPSRAERENSWGNYCGLHTFQVFVFFLIMFSFKSEGGCWKMFIPHT